MAIISGQGTALQIGQETTWGTKASPTQAVNFTSENFKFVPEYKEEDTLVGGTTSRSIDIMKKSVSWDFSELAKPDDIGLIFGLAFGSEAAPVETGDAGYKHVFTMIHPSLDAALPSFTGTIDRHVAVKAYVGCEVDSLSFNCNAGDYVRLQLSGIGKDEVTGTKDTSLVVPQLKAFRFAGGTCLIDDVAYGSITSVSFSLSNALDGGEQTMGSGYYSTKAEPQKRAVTVSLGTEYNAATESIHEDKFKTGATASVVLNFVSPEVIETGINYSVKIILPAVVVNDCSPVVGGNEKLRVTIGGVACESIDSNDDVVEAVSVELVDKRSTKYLA